MTTGSISTNHLLFVAEYLKQPPAERDAAAAYARVYNLPPGRSRSAVTGAARCLRRPDVQAEIARQEAAAIERAGITPEEVVREITLLAKADPRQLMEIHRGACRYCYGLGHLYQRTPREIREAMINHQVLCKAAGKEDPHCLRFEHEGGPGFNPTKAPHPNCPECFGLGEVYEHLKDSREWTPGAARLYAGVERTKEGLKVKTRSQDRALNLAAQMHHLLRAPAAGEDGENNIPPPSEIVYQAQDASKKGGAD